MAHRGQRYFEQPLPDTNDQQPPKKRRPAFHEVFGNRNFRRFQQQGPGRGRHNTRGRGRDNRAFQFSAPRNPNKRYQDRNYHDVNNQERNFHNRNPIDKNPRDKNPRDRDPRDRDPRERDPRNGNNHQGTHHDTDPRELSDDFPANGQEQPLFGQGSKRTAFQPIDFDGRRKKKRVAGGRIKKFERIEEFKGSTYCDVCNEGFRDINAKVLHERSKAHRRNFGYLRYETVEFEDKDEQFVDIANTNKASEEVRRENIEKGTAAFLSGKPLPKDFKDWAERSLTAARQAAAESNDPSLIQAVQREVIEVYRVNDENCSLRRVCWTRRDPATGSAYRDTSLAPPSLPVIKDSELTTKDKVEANIKNESSAGEQKSALSPEKVKQNAHAEVGDAHFEEDPVEILDEAPPPPPPTVQQPPPSDPRPERTSSVNNNLLPTAHLPPYNEVKLRWQLSKAARAMLSCCRTAHKEVVLAKYNDRFAETTIRENDSEKDQADVKPKESLKTEYREVQRQLESEEYEYDDLMERLSKLARQLRDDRRRVSQLRDVLQMQTKIALQVGEFRDCRQPCSAFVRTFVSPLSIEKSNVDMVGQWFVSILLKVRPGSSKRDLPAMLEVAQEMRRFPAGVGGDVWVHEAIQAFRCVLGYNWSGFFKRSVEQCQGSPLSQILEGFIPFMRKKALVMLTRMSRWEKTPLSIPLPDFQRQLAWESSDDADASIEEVKDFVTSLSHPFVIGRDHKDRECIQWSGGSIEELSISEDVDVQDDVLSKWRKIRILKED